MSSQAFAFSQKFTTDDKGGQVWSVKGYLRRIIDRMGDERRGAVRCGAVLVQTKNVSTVYLPRGTYGAWSAVVTTS